MSLIRVRVADPTVNQVALWERHPAHPGGEVFIAGAGEFEVAATPAVEARLRNGRLVQVETAVAPAATETPETAAPGGTTGVIADAGMLQFVTVTSDDANKVVTLPTPTPGTAAPEPRAPSKPKKATPPRGKGGL